ncbi:MAG: hypothetical protein PHW46_02855 [Candidatus Omnitrophica bacterium]|nr:hypothetical protein [Candidatus Omnitrophota bacterium]
MQYLKFTKFIYITLLVFFLLGGSKASADVVYMRTGAKYEGLIIDADENEILFKARNDGKYFIGSFYKKDIENLELAPYNFPEKATMFDELIFEKGADLEGRVEIETPDAVYFSLHLKGGVGIVEIKRSSILGIEGAYGLRNNMAKTYFRSLYFLYDAKQSLQRAIKERKISAFTKSPSSGLDNASGTDQLDNIVAGRKVFLPRSLKNFLGEKYSLTKDQQYELGVKGKYLVLGMDKEQIKAVLGDPGERENGKVKEYWVYPNGVTVVLFKDKLVGYTKKNRKKILEDVNKFYGDKIIIASY